jgi:hypothetical protein
VTRLAGLKRWARRRPRRALAAALFVGSILTWIGYEFISRRTAEDRYRAAVAEADRLDPGWRDGITTTDLGPIPDDQNSASLVVSSYEQIPPDWEPSQGNWWLLKIDPARAVPAEMMAELRQRRDQAKEGLALARALADRPRGRFPPQPLEVPRSRPMASRQVQMVSRLLYLDGLVRIEEGDLLRAAANVKAMIHAGRAIGDQPHWAFQVARMRAIDTALLTLERLLAHGELPEPVLADLQKLLESEVLHPLALISWRGDRAAVDKLFEDVRTGRTAAASLFEPSDGWLAVLYTMRAIRENQARLLEMNNRMVELAKLPIEQQGTAINEVNSAYFRSWDNAGFLERFYLLPFREHARGSAGNFQSNHHASVGVAILALASERFRLAQGRWPKSAAELVPAYLSALPCDPYTGAALHFKPDQERLVLYSNGFDAKDDSGLWVRGGWPGAGKDTGFILDAVEKRRRSAVAK